jgi:hypothetical protein
MFSILVATMTVIALGFVVAWWLRPEIRDLVEDPKYKFVRWGGSTDDAVQANLANQASVARTIADERLLTCINRCVLTEGA